MTKATATQNSGFEEHRTYPFNDASTAVSTALPSGATPVSRCTIADGRIGGDAADVAHRRLAGRGDGLFRIRELDRELVFQRLALGFRGRVELFAGLGADRLRAGAGRGEFGFHRPSARRRTRPSASAPRRDRPRSRPDGRRSSCRRAARRYARRSGKARRTRSAATPAAKQRCPSGTAETGPCGRHPPRYGPSRPLP